MPPDFTTPFEANEPQPKTWSEQETPTAESYKTVEYVAETETPAPMPPSDEPFLAEKEILVEEKTTIKENPAALSEDELKDSENGDCVKWLLTIILLLLVGIGAWYFFFKKEPTTTLPPPPPVVSDNDDNNLIGPDGGTVSDSTGARVVVPAGALDTKIRLEIVKVRDGRVTDLYHLLPDGLAFNKPVTVFIPYKEENLYSWETPFEISLWYGSQEDPLDVQKRTAVTLAEKLVSTAVTTF